MKKQILHIITWKEDKLFIAKFLELELASQGHTKKEATQNLKEAFDLYREDENINNLQFPMIEEVTTQIFALN